MSTRLFPAKVPLAISLLLVIYLCIRSMANAQQTLDAQRESEVARIVSALESYAAVNGSYAVAGAGHLSRGAGWFHHDGGSYEESIASALADLGHLNAPLPKDPLHPITSVFSSNDFLVYQCKNRVAVFSRADSITPDPADQDWWQRNNCTQYPISGLGHPYFKLSRPLGAVNLDSRRASEVARVVSALESYAAERGTYAVTGAGHLGRGAGWFHHDDGSYEESIANALASLDYLTTPLPKDPLHPVPGTFSSNDFLVYQCKDRVAVFSRADSMTPNPAHLDWWQRNNCTQYPVTGLGHTYFELSGPLNAVNFDTQRRSEVARVVSALESYAVANRSYAVAGAGHLGKGAGWFHHDSGSYEQSIANTLANLNYLTAPLPKDPLHPVPSVFSSDDFLVYQCRDRVAVFSRADSMTPNPAHQDWWQRNNCTEYPINGLGHTYFELSAPLPPAVQRLSLTDYRLVFEDNFNGSSLDPSKWDTGFLWGPYFPINNEEQLYVDTLGMHSGFFHSPFEFTGSTLKITATPTDAQLQPPPRPPENDPAFRPRPYSEYVYNGPTADGPGYQPDDVNYLSGLITTYGSLRMAHGYVEMRAKLPPGRGLWPAFWLLNVHYVENSPEIDVMEFIGHQTDRLYHTYHYYDIYGTWNYRSTPTFATFADDWTQEFHTFGMAWSPTEIVWYVDGVETRRITDEEYTMPNQSMYLLANLAVGGNWAGAPDADTVFPATFEIDYIRAYERKLNPQLDLANDYQLMFEDNFNGSTLDANKWKTSFLWGPYLTINQEEQYLVDALGADRNKVTSANTPFRVSNGVLSITARRADDPDAFPIPERLPGINDPIWSDHPSYQRDVNYSPGNYTSGIITSYESFKFVNGYVEARARVPRGQGLWPAFWLLNGYYVGTQPEIDILEILGDKPGRAYHTFHRLDSSGTALQTQGISPDYGDPNIGYSDRYHTYGLRWQRGRLDWYIDGKVVFTYEGDDVPYQNMYVIANLAVGGTWPGAPDSSTQFPASYDIDYIRVYQEKSK